ncbi:MAG: GH36-type glycosyl hydrolase domain-containing protein [Planctomycetota bacterium]
MDKPEKLAETPYGYFDVEQREYVIKTPATPAPWINYLGLEGELCGIVSNTAGGPTWLKDPLERRVTRYVQVGSLKDRPGRWLYLRDRDSGEFWCPTYKPVTRVKPDFYECRHGLGYTGICATHDDIRAELMHLIPLGEHIEVQRVLLRNEGDRTRRISAFSYREFVNGTAANDLANVQYSGHIARVEPDPEDDRVLHVTTVRQAEHPTPFYAVSEPPAGYDTKCDAFIGDGTIENPQVVREGRCRGSIAADDTAVGVYQVDLELEPGEEKVLHLIVGLAWSREEARAVLDRWLGDDTRVLAALGELKDHASDLLSSLHCAGPDPCMDVMVNTWNAYQCWINFQFSRSISGYAAGLRRSMGTRDSLQDLLGYMHMAPDRARERILELMEAVHLQNGSARHQYSALTREGSEATGYSDDHLWAVLAAAAYVKETGDASILDEEFSYSDDRALSEDLYHHLLRAVGYSFGDLGEHGLPRLRAADWNDTLGEGPDDEVSESVLVGMMLVRAAREMIELTRVGGREDLTTEQEGGPAPVLEYFQRIVDTLTENLNREAWLEDGWYARGTDAEGRWFGVPSRAEGKIFLEPQPWSVMAGVAGEERGARAMDSVQDRLATPKGIAIIAPACSEAPSGDFDVFPKGAKENGAIFCHPNPWAVCAEALLGRGERAFAYYRSILPAAAGREDPEHYCAEPYVYGQQRYGPEHREFGKLAGTWLTGTAAWNYVAATQYILGVRPDYDGLRVDPCIPAGWEEFCVVRKFRGASYHVDVLNPDGVCKGVRSVTVDGEEIEGNLLPVFADGGVHAVRVVMG